MTYEDALSMANHGVDNGGAGDSDHIFQGLMDYMHTLVSGVGGSSGMPPPPLPPSHQVAPGSNSRQPPVLHPKMPHREVGTDVLVNGNGNAPEAESQGSAPNSPAPVLPPRKRDRKPASPVSGIVVCHVVYYVRLSCRND